jgi:hypothetical protein
MLFRTLFSVQPAMHRAKERSSDMKRLLGLLLTTAAFAFAGDQVPFVATFTSSVPSADLPTCAAGQMPVALAGTGQATHMGLFTEIQSHCVDPTTGAFTGGQFKMTGANGDTVYGTYHGQLRFTSSTTAAIEGLFQLTGGTGRFSGAIGGGIATGTLDFTTGETNDLLLKG